MKYIILIIRILLILVFVALATFKLTGSEATATTFVSLGLPAWAPFTIGLLELLGAIGLAIGHLVRPGLAKLAAAGLILVSLGAVGAHLINDPIMTAVPALVLVVLLAIFIKFGKESWK